MTAKKKTTEPNRDKADASRQATNDRDMDELRKDCLNYLVQAGLQLRAQIRSGAPEHQFAELSLNLWRVVHAYEDLRMDASTIPSPFALLAELDK